MRFIQYSLRAEAGYIHSSCAILTVPLESFGVTSPLPKHICILPLRDFTLLVSMQGQYVALACSRHGSRVLDAIWSGAALGARKEIAAELGEYHWVVSPNRLLLHLVADIRRL